MNRLLASALLTFSLVTSAQAGGIIDTGASGGTSGGGGATGSVTSAGTSGSNAQAVQGITGGVPQAVDTVVRGIAVDRGGTLTTASTAVTLIPANPSRRGVIIQNRNAPGSSYNAANSIFYNCQATATGTFHDLEVPAGAEYETPVHHVGTGACSFISATASTGVYLREF